MMDETQAIIEAQRITMFGTLLAALVGGLIGFLSSWLVTALNSRSERKRLLLQLGFELGMKQWESAFGLASKQADRGYNTSIIPPYVYVNFNMRVLELLANGELTPDSLQALDIENNNIVETIKGNVEQKG
jgi:hypothetical protein